MDIYFLFIRVQTREEKINSIFNLIQSYNILKIRNIAFIHSWKLIKCTIRINVKRPNNSQNRGYRIQNNIFGKKDNWDQCPSRFISNCKSCLLYTSDAADEEDSVDLGGR